MGERKDFLKTFLLIKNILVASGRFNVIKISMYEVDLNHDFDTHVCLQAYFMRIKSR